MLDIPFELFSYSIPAFTSLLLFTAYILGSILYYLSRLDTIKEAYLDVFTKTFLGIISIILVYAIIITKGVTIQWGFVLIGFVALWLGQKFGYGKSKNNKAGFTKAHILPMFVLQVTAIGLFMLQGSLYYNTPFNNIPHGDYNFYSIVLEAYTKYGIETRDPMIDVINTGFYGPGLYHHTELWLANLYYKTLDILSVEAQITGLYPIIGSILAIGFIALSKTITDLKSVHYLSPFFVFFSGIPLWEILHQTPTFVFGVADNTKNIMSALFFISAFILLIKKNRLFFIPLLALPIVNMVNLPAVFGAMFLTGILAYRYQFFKIKTSQYLVFLPILISAFIIFFYFISAQFFPEKPIREFSINEIINGLKDYPMRPLLILGGTFVIMLSIYFMHIVILLISKLINKKIKLPHKLLFSIVFVFFINIIGLFTWSFTNVLKDSVQFYCIPSVISLNILLFSLFAYYSDKFKGLNKATFKAFSISFFILLLVNYATISKNNEFLNFFTLKGRSVIYLKKVEAALNKKDEVILAQLINPEKLTSYWFAIPYHQPSVYIKSIKSEVRQVSLTTIEIPIDSFINQAHTTVKREVENAPFTRFVNELKAKNRFTTIGAAQVQFMKVYKVDYLLVDPKTKIPEEFNSIIEEVFIDELSKEKFIIIKK